MNATEAFARFDQDLARQDKSTLTRSGYQSDLRDYARWVQATYGEAFEPDTITADDVRQYRAYLLNVRHVKPATINRRLAALSMFCRWALHHDLLNDDPTTDVPAAQQARSAPKALNRSDLNRLLRKVKQSSNPLHVAVLLTLANTGLRVGELVTLETSDVDITERSGKVRVRLGKGSRYREVPLNAEVRQALRKYSEMRPQPAGKVASLFISQRGEALTSSGVWRMLSKYARQAGLEHISPHVLRHSFASLLLREQQIDLVTVADLLGIRASTRPCATRAAPKSIGKMPWSNLIPEELRTTDRHKLRARFNFSRRQKTTDSRMRKQIADLSEPYHREETSWLVHSLSHKPFKA